MDSGIEAILFSHVKVILSECIIVKCQIKVYHSKLFHSVDPNQRVSVGAGHRVSNKLAK